MIFNPLKEKITRTIKVPLYYTGLKNTAAVQIEESNPFTLKLNGTQEIELNVTIDAESYTWITIE